MTTEGLLHSEDDIARFVANPRFLAAAHVYSMDEFLVGEAIIRAADGQPYGETTYTNVTDQVHAQRLPPDSLRRERQLDTTKFLPHIGRR
jgi:hypothetical protein